MDRALHFTAAALTHHRLQIRGEAALGQFIVLITCSHQKTSPVPHSYFMPALAFVKCILFDSAE